MIARAPVAAAALLFALPLAAAWQDGVPVALRLLAWGLAGLALVRPAWALAVTAGLLPLATPITLIAGAPFSAVETLHLLALPTLAGAAARRVVAAPPVRPSPLFWPAVAMAAVVAGLLIVQLAIAQLAADFVAPYFAGLWRHLTRSFFTVPRDYPPLQDAMLWLEALGLAVLASHVLRGPAAERGVVFRVAVAGMTGAACMSILRLAEVMTRSDAPLATAWQMLTAIRFSPLVPDINAAGSLFVFWVVALAWWAWRGGPRLLWPAVACLAFALWTTGSRSAMAAAVLGMGAAWALTRRPAPARLTVALVVLIVLGGLATLDPGRSEATAGTALSIRGAIYRMGVTLATRDPVFGIGFGGFRRESRVLASPELRAAFPPIARGDNAHNNFLQILVEFGAIGLLAFLWLVGAALAPLVPAVRAGPVGGLAAGLAGGLVAFLVTCLPGHPLLVPQVLVPFGLMLGFVSDWAGEAARAASSATGAQRSRARLAALTAVAVVAVSVPWRAATARTGADLAGVAVGGAPVVVEGRTWQRVGVRARWFVAADALAVVVEIRDLSGGTGCVAAVAVDGRPTGAGGAVAGLPLRLRLDLPAASDRAARRIDLELAGDDCAVLAAPVEVRTSR